MSEKVEVKLQALAPYGGPKRAFAFTLPDSLPIDVAIRGRKFIRVLDRNWKSKSVFIR
jgi:hypothetical protein